jgi:hypothetical protein
MNSPGETEETHINLIHDSDLTRSRFDFVPPECEAGKNIVENVAAGRQ